MYVFQRLLFVKLSTKSFERRQVQKYRVIRLSRLSVGIVFFINRRNVMTSLVSISLLYLDWLGLKLLRQRYLVVIAFRASEFVGSESALETEI